MNYAEIISELIAIIGVLVVVVNIITEVFKNVVEFKTTQRINIFVLLLSEAITVMGFCAYWQYKGLEFAWYLVVAFVVIGFMVAFASMFGYDKLLKYLEDIKR